MPDDAADWDDADDADGVLDAVAAGVVDPLDAEVGVLCAPQPASASVASRARPIAALLTAVPLTGVPP